MSEPIHKPLESESHSPDVKSDHPTGRVRYSSKQPPAFSGDRAPAPENPAPLPDVPLPESGDLDMSDYAPTKPGDMNMEVDDDHDPMRMPMDVSQFVHRLTPPPEELVQGRDSQGGFCPIYVPSKP